MKREQWISRSIALVMAFVLALAGVGCIVTGFHLSADMTVLGWNIFIAAVIAVLASSFGKGNFILLAVLALFLNHLWYSGDLESSLEFLVYTISVRFNNAYLCGVLFWGDTLPESAALEPALSVLSIPVVWTVAWTVLRRRPAILAVPVSILMPAVCFVILNSVPETWYLFLLCTGLLLLMLTQTVRRRTARDGNRLVALLLIPAVLCTGILFWAIPKEGYSPKFETPQWLQKLMTITIPGIGPGVGGTDPAEEVNLAKLGPKSQAQTEVMQVTATNQGVTYLRGQAYDHYAGNTWTISGVDTTKDAYWPAKNMEAAGRVTIKTAQAQTLRYVPYYTRNGAYMNQIVNGRLEGEEETLYSFLVVTRTGNYNLNTAVVKDELVLQCLQLPETTAAQAKQIVKEIGIYQAYSDGVKAQTIKNYVRDLAEYDTATGAMPSDRDDFALWFLTEAESGYCVHFATAATVLLRAAGVPARYVTGYMVNVGEGYTIVEQRHAHAWVEYLDSERGWTVLDPTPVSEDPIVTEPTEPPVTDPTEPSESTEHTRPTGPSESSEPTGPNASEPTGSTEPGESTAPQQTQSSRGQTAAHGDWRWLWEILLYAALICGPILLIAGQYFLRIGLRKRRRRRADTNRRALEDWREVNRLSRLLGQALPEELEELAEKAKFSQHTLTAEESDAFCQQITVLREELRRKNPFWRFVLKLVFAIE